MLVYPSIIIDFKTGYLCQVCTIFPDNFCRLQVNNSRLFFQYCSMITVKTVLELEYGWSNKRRFKRSSIKTCSKFVKKSIKKLYNKIIANK